MPFILASYILALFHDIMLCECDLVLDWLCLYFVCVNMIIANNYINTTDWKQMSLFKQFDLFDPKGRYVDDYKFWLQ